MGDYVKSMIFGGLDGILTSFAIVAGAAGGRLPVQVVLVLGFSNIFADAFSMGMGEFLSSKAHNEFVLKEKDRETWCVRACVRMGGWRVGGQAITDCMMAMRCRLLLANQTQIEHCKPTYKQGA